MQLEEGVESHVGGDSLHQAREDSGSSWSSPFACPSRMEAHRKGGGHKLDSASEDNVIMSRS